MQTHNYMVIMHDENQPLEAMFDAQQQSCEKNSQYQEDSKDYVNHKFSV